TRLDRDRFELDLHGLRRLRAGRLPCPLCGFTCIGTIGLLRRRTGALSPRRLVLAKREGLVGLRPLYAVDLQEFGWSFCRLEPQTETLERLEDCRAFPAGRSVGRGRGQGGRFLPLWAGAAGVFVRRVQEWDVESSVHASLIEDVT